MASKINYNNKAPFQTLEEIPDKNKVNAADMNEIKQVVNTNADELNTAKEDIENLETEQGTSNTEITNLKNRVTTLETENSTNKTDIANLEENKVDKVEGKGLSTEDFTTELKSKLESLENYDDTEIKEDISNLEAGQTEQDKQIDILLNALPTETAEAENINIKGTIPVKFKEFKVSGNSKQETTDTMPSPEFPSPIQNVEGDVNITVYNKNLADPEEVWENMQAYNSSYCSEVVEEGKECIRFATSFFRPDVATPFNLINYRYKENTQYTIRMLVKKDSTQANGRLFVQIIYTDGTNEIEYAESSNWIELKIVSNSQKTIDKIGFSYNTNTYYFLDKSSLFIAEGDTTDYVEHQEQNVTFPLTEGQKLYKGDYLADDGIHHVREQVELDGTENWELYSDKAARISRSDVKGVPNVSHIGSILSNFFKTETQADLQMGVADNGIAVRAEGNNGIVIRIAEFTTLQEYKDWLSSKKSEGTPVIAEYELSEEEIEAYTEEQQEAYNQLKQLTAYEEETNIYSTNKVGPVFTVTAVKNINSVITQLNTVLLERS